MLRVFITGISGFIGQHLSRQMKAEGHLVTGTTFNVNDTEHIQCDIRNPEEIRVAIAEANPDIIIHLAAISSVTLGKTLEYYECNVVGTENVIAAVKGLDGRRRLVFVSSAAVYGNQSVEVLTEDLQPLPVSHYGMSKFVCERMLANETENIDYTIIRPFNFIGEGQSDNFIVPKLINHFVERAPSIKLGNLVPVRDYLDVQTACEIISDLATNPKAIGETVNLCSGVGTSVRELLDILIKLTGHEIEVIADPKFFRKSEVWRLLGSPDKLHRLCSGGNKPRDLESIISQILDTAVIKKESI
ncbi:nucleoside-diphosphate-sugar epimerase [Undibacterium sp. GrIS 1.2]|uniref:NAD-dependent epimerase/dehydratase family protein n=1 Tax=Undibacterium sp. GrIS 1.2 TaxID=3143933 RepID=UPI003397286F